MKRAKIVSAITLLLLCVCMLAVGVVAADVSPQVGMSGSITVPANQYIISVKGFIGENIDTSNLPAPDFCSVGTEPEDNPNGTVYGSEWVFTSAQLQKMSFNLSGVNTLDDLKKKSIYITFLIETTSNFDMRAYFTKETDTDVWEESDSDVLGEDAISVLLNKADIEASGTNNTKETFISIRFSPLKFAEGEEGDKYSFSYILNVEEDIPDTTNMCEVDVVVNPEYIGGTGHILAYSINNEQSVLFDSAYFTITCEKGDVIKLAFIAGEYSGNNIWAASYSDITAKIGASLYITATSGESMEFTVNNSMAIEVVMVITP